MIFEPYGPQGPTPSWYSREFTPPSPDRKWAPLGQPLYHLSGEPSPEALWCLQKQYHGKQRRKLEMRYFGKRKCGPRSSEPS